MLNILYIETGTQGGGSFESLYLLLKHIDRSKYNPIVLFLNHTRYVELVKSLNIQVHTFKDPVYTINSNRILLRVMRLFRSLFNLYQTYISIIGEYILHYSLIKYASKLAIKERIKIIHCNNHINRNFFCNFIAKKLNLILISHTRTFSVEGFNRYKAGYSNKVVAKYIAVSARVKELWVKHGLDDKKIKVIHNGIESVKVNKINIRDKLKICDNNKKVLAVVGSYNHTRGYELMLETLSLLVRKGSGYCLVIIGPDTKEALMSLVKELGLESYVVFVGQVERAVDYIANIDLLIIPYSVEPFGRTLLESWMVKTPVILSDINYIRDVVVADKNCILFNYGNAADLAAKVENLLKDKEMIRDMVENGYAFVNKRFNIKQCVKKIEDIYQEILA